MPWSSIARKLGADPATASGIGLTIDIAVPTAFSLSLAAARVVAIRAGQISLVEHEALEGARLGGHTIAKHVGRTEEQLRARLLAERVPAASTFPSLRAAEQAVSRALRANAATIKTWAQTASQDQLVLTHDAGFVTGSGVVRATGRLTSMSKVRVVLKLQTYNGQPYYILTAFPIP
jgi:hypothetical protein